MTEGNAAPPKAPFTLVGKTAIVTGGARGIGGKAFIDGSALNDVDGHVGLAFHAGGEVLSGRGGDRRVALNDARHSPA